MQVIQRFLLDKRQDEALPEPPPDTSSPSIRVVAKAFQNQKYSPVLSKRSTQPRMNASSSIKPRATSKSDFSPIATSPTKLNPAKSSRSIFNPSSKKLLSSYSSLDIIKPNKSILQKKLLSNTLTMSNPKTLKKQIKTQTKPEPKPEVLQRVFDSKISTKPELDRVWRKIFFMSNGFETYSGNSSSYFAYVDKGNNSPLIKKLILARPWWKLADKKEKAHFVWSQWKNKSTLESMKSCEKVIKTEDLPQINWPVIGKSLMLKGRNNENEQFGLSLIINSPSFSIVSSEKSFSESQKLHNHIESNFCLTNKKGLYHTMRTYCEVSGKDLFSIIPLTFNITSESDPEYSEFLHQFELNESKKPETKNVWIVKPGENTNRGNGITVCDTLESINEIIKPVENKTYIIQKYIENPLLINKRKFDIRCYALLTSINGVLQGYFYLDGYLRTASQEFDIEVCDKFVHLTNDAIQKHSAEYGKYENGNKMSYREFCNYLEVNHPGVEFYSGILPRIKEIVRECFLASFMEIDKKKRMHCMEVFGFDFMIDSEFKPWLIEINTNPCLELASPHLRIIIPSMIENAFKIVLDSVFPAPFGQSQEYVQVNRFELIFHQEKEGRNLIESVSKISIEG